MILFAGVQRRWISLAIAVCVLVLLYALTREVWWARTSPVVHDAAILHYVAWMISRGHAPYLQQVEMNLPGVLMTEWLSMHVFGGDAAGLWRWDTFVGLCAVGAVTALAGRGVRLAAACGGMLTWLVHLNDGAFDLGEREWWIAALLVGAGWFAVRCMESRRAVWMAPCLVLAGWASAEKPFAALMSLMLVGVVLVDARWPSIWGEDARARVLPLLGWSVAGGLVPVLATVLYFRHWPGAFSAFLLTEHTLGAWYAGQGRASVGYMVLRVMSYPLLLVLLFGLYLAVRARVWRERRGGLLLAGFAVSVVMYLAQRKGFPYHVYPLLLFGLPLGFVCAQRGLRSLSWDRKVAAVVLLLVGAVRLPLKLWRDHANAEYPVGTQQAVVADLQRLGGASLNGSVQCLDMTLGGCIGALYQLRLQQPTGFVNDNMLFPVKYKPFLADLQAIFLKDISTKQPKVIVLSAHNWPNQEDLSFSKLQRWPEFANYLSSKYVLESTHVAHTKQRTADYRVYVRR